MKRTSVSFFIGLVLVVTACGGEESTQNLAVAAQGVPLEFHLNGYSGHSFKIHLSANRTQLWGTRKQFQNNVPITLTLTDPFNLAPSQVEEVAGAIQAMTLIDYSGSSCTERKKSKVAYDGDFTYVIFAGQTFGETPLLCRELYAPSLNVFLDIFEAAATSLE